MWVVSHSLVRCSTAQYAFLLTITKNMAVYEFMGCKGATIIKFSCIMTTRKTKFTNQNTHIRNNLEKFESQIWPRIKSTLLTVPLGHRGRHITLVRNFVKKISLQRKAKVDNQVLYMLYLLHIRFGISYCFF